MKRLMLLLIAGLMAAGAYMAPASASSISDQIFLAHLRFCGKYDNCGGHQESSSSGFLADGTFTAEHDFAGDWHDFDDQIDFTVSGTTDLLVTASTWGDIVLNLTLYKAGDLVNALYSFSDVSNFSQTLANLAGGDYILDLAGGACHCAKYVVTLAATPLPPALMLFLTAIGGLGLIGYIRMPKGSALA